MIHMAFGISFIAVALYRVFKHPEELALFVLLLHSTFRLMVEGNAVAWGEKGSNIRFEYLFFFIALYIFSRHVVLPEYRVQSAVVRALTALLVMNMISIPLAYLWGLKIGVGVAIRQLATYAYILILIHVTKRGHLPKLLNGMLVIAGIIAMVLLVLNVTKNPLLYQLINGRDMEGRLVTIGGEVLGADFGWLAYSIHSLPILGCMAFILFLLKKRFSLWYGLIVMIILLQGLASGQRSNNLALIAGLLIVVATLPFLFRSRVGLSKLVMVTGAMALAVFLAFTESQAMSARLMLLLTRAQATYDGLQSDSQQVGHQLAMEQLEKDGPMAWMFGYSGFFLTRTMGRFSYDVNSPIVMVMKFGLIGTALLLYGLILIFLKAVRMLLSGDHGAEEVAVLYGIFLFILIWLPGSFLRGSVFAENIRMLSWFGIWVAWMEVVDRDQQRSRRIRVRPGAHTNRSVEVLR
jgi:hypothetical protein